MTAPARMGRGLTEADDCFIGICKDEVRCAVVNDTGVGQFAKQALEEWGADPRITEIVRVPVEVARMFLFQKWPGREAAIAAAKDPGRAALAEREGTDRG